MNAAKLRFSLRLQRSSLTSSRNCNGIGPVLLIAGAPFKADSLTAGFPCTSGVALIGANFLCHKRFDHFLDVCDSSGDLPPQMSSMTRANVRVLSTLLMAAGSVWKVCKDLEAGAEIGLRLLVGKPGLEVLLGEGEIGFGRVLYMFPR